MRGKQQLFGGMRLLAWLVPALLLAACASMGRPEGGARDEEPPRYVSSNPRPGATGVSPTRITVNFDENVQLEEAFSKVVVSPAQKNMPQVSSNGKRVTVILRDTLLPNTTYTIDFADAIKDLNEGNILDGFALDFSTGDVIDTLRISGMVLQAENLEPAQGMLVGVYSAMTDTTLTTLPMDRIARTNQLGQFTIRNLPEGEYHIFAINDVNRDYHWDRSEDIAFYDTTITPWVENIMVTDTLYSSTGADSIVTRSGIRFMPNDVLLTWFNTGYRAQYLAEYKRPERRKFTLQFGAPSDTLPTVTIVDGAPGTGRLSGEWALLQPNATRDTLEYWITDPEVLAADSLRLAVHYLKTDTADQLSWTDDTLRFFFREPKDNKKKKKKDEEEDDTPKFLVDSVTGDTTFLPPPDMEWLVPGITSGSRQELHMPLRLTASLPLATVDTAGIHLEQQVDTVWTALPFTLRPDSTDRYRSSYIDVKWTEGGKYRLRIDTLAMTSVYGPFNRPFSQDFTAKNLDDYSNLNFMLPGTDSLRLVVQLLTSNDTPVYTTVKPAGTDVAHFTFLNPGPYYARLFVDTTPNGKWDTGSPTDSIQPEEVYYYSKKLDLKKNWDVDQTWDIYELAVDKQKPYAIKKNKPKLKRGEEAPRDESEFGEDDIYDPFGNPNRTGNNSNRNSNSFGGFGSGSLMQSTGAGNLLRR
ncbi:MAG: hypothetical protein HDS78_06385 [Bacteroidales bacterium]|nr:hypothetical protein [Bacteroidales bacterium]